MSNTTEYKSYDDLPIIISPIMLSEILKISKSTAYRLIKSNKIKHKKYGNKIIITKENFIYWINNEIDIDKE